MLNIIRKYIKFKVVPMQRKHLIVLTLATIFMLLSYNIISSYFHEKSRAALLESDTPVVVESDNEANNTIAEQPLGEQPKAIIDSATNQVEQAQNVEQQRLEQIDKNQ